MDHRLEHLVDLTRRVDYPEYRWRVEPMGDGHFIQARYDEPDIHTGAPAEQAGRKWYISRHATNSEVVQTMFLALKTSHEHRLREHFRFDGQRVFQPHFSIEELRDFAAQATEDRRNPMPQPERVLAGSG